MICAESLFLADFGVPRDRGEHRYRLSLRSAVFIQSPPHTRRAIYAHMRRAYDARSAIVHDGGEPRPDVLKSLDGAQIPLDEFATTTEHSYELRFQRPSPQSRADQSQSRIGTQSFWATESFHIFAGISAGTRLHIPKSVCSMEQRLPSGDPIAAFR